MPSLGYFHEDVVSTLDTLIRAGKACLIQAIEVDLEFLVVMDTSLFSLSVVRKERVLSVQLKQNISHSRMPVVA